MTGVEKNYRETPFFWTNQHDVSIKYAGLSKDAHDDSAAKNQILIKNYTDNTLKDKMFLDIKLLRL